MAKTKAPWVVVKDNAAKCLRCGATETLPLPMSIPDFVKWAERFTKGHSACGVKLDKCPRCDGVQETCSLCGGNGFITSNGAAIRESDAPSK